MANKFEIRKSVCDTALFGLESYATHWGVNIEAVEPYVFACTVLTKMEFGELPESVYRYNLVDTAIYNATIIVREEALKRAGF